ncbi:hypothetical protein GCM10023197_42060 [Gordonia humi]
MPQDANRGSVVGGEQIAERVPGVRRGPLSGVKVADFCWMGVGAVATRMLADFGAEVIRIEDRDRPDLPRRLPLYKGEVRAYGDIDPNPDPNKGGLFNNYNRNKLGITLNMRTEKGREIAERLIADSGIVTENFAPGVLEKWGLTRERIEELRPGSILARMAGFGHDGPHHRFRSYGPVIQAVCGLSFNSGLPGREPSAWGMSYMDNQAAYYNAIALMTAIYHRKRTGEGMYLDVSAVEAGIGLLGPDLLDTLVNGRPSRRPDFPRGNRLEFPDAAPHGVYPASGEDQWIAVAVFDEKDWSALVEVMGRPEWAIDDRFATMQARLENVDALDALLGEWTVAYDKHTLMHLLQKAGVTAGAVQNSRDLVETDPQIAARGTFFELDHPVIGPALFEGIPMRLSGSEQHNWRSAPLMGEDNDHVLSRVLGMDADEIGRLAAEGII